MNRNYIFLFVVFLLSSCSKTLPTPPTVNLNKSIDSLFLNKPIILNIIISILFLIVYQNLFLSL